MLFGLIGGIKESIEWGKEDFFEGFFRGLLIDVAVALTGGAVALTTTAAVMDNQNTVNRVQIEQNVASSAHVAKFTGNAFTVTRKDDKTYLEMFGVAIKNPGDGPQFASYTYNIDKELYDKIFKYVDIEYNYGTSGQLTGASNQMRSPDFWFGCTKSKLAEHDILSALVKVTETEVVAEKYYASSQLTTAAVGEHSQNGAYAVSGIGGVSIDEANKIASFTIDLVDLTQDGAVTAKRLLVEQKLTAEMEEDPSLAYKNYAEDYKSCNVQDMKLGTYLYTTNDYTFEIPDDCVM